MTRHAILPHPFEPLTSFLAYATGDERPKLRPEWAHIGEEKMASMNLPLTKDGNDDGWEMPTLEGATVCGAAPFFDSDGDLIGYAVNVGWNDTDALNREAIIDAVNSAPTLKAQNEWLKARIASLQLPANKHDHDTREKFLVDCGMPV